jgi:hypothetical protein
MGKTSKAVRKDTCKEVLVVEDGQVKPGWCMKATISVDHRVSDGAEAAQPKVQALPKVPRDDVAGFLENPRMLVGKCQAQVSDLRLFLSMPRILPIQESAPVLSLSGLPR